MPSLDEHALRESLESLPAETRELLRTHGFSAAWLVEQARASASGTRSNTVVGKIEPLAPGELLGLPEAGSTRHLDLTERGEEALASGKCALAILAGGMATRMGGVIKALVPALGARTFLDLRLSEQAALTKRYGVEPPLWLMTSHATHAGIEEALGSVLQERKLALFRQGISVRLDQDGRVFRSASGEPSLYSPGHGDFVDSLRRSGLLAEFVQNGGKCVLAANLDNLGAGLDPLLIGLHLEAAAAVTCEVVDRGPTDKGGVPVRLAGAPVVLEDFRLPASFDPMSIPIFSINNFWFNAEQLLEANLAWTHFEVTKNVEGNPAIQYERLINEVTFGLSTQYVRVPRTGSGSRFLPVKDYDELALRTHELEAVARARGMLNASSKELS